MFARIILSSALFAATSAAAQVPLRDQTEISEGLIAAAIAYEIGDKCDSISARMVRGVMFLNGLRARAADLGYSDADIEAYMDDRDEKRRLEAEARARLAAMGAVVGDWQTYCSVGTAEIAAGSQIGRLLR